MSSKHSSLKNILNLTIQTVGKTITLVTLYIFTIFQITRVYLLLTTGIKLIPFKYWPIIFMKGIWFDFFTICYLIGPLVLLKLLLNKFKYRSILSSIALYILIYLFLFISVVEILFWNEFHSRLNFISVDYLLYTNEVIGNIIQSFPIGRILFTILILSIFIYRYLKKQAALIKLENIKIRSATRLFIMILVAPIIGTLIAKVDQMNVTGNAYATEISGNGIFTFFSALRRNELDYDMFYKKIPQKQADTLLSELKVKREPLDSIENYIEKTQEKNNVITFLRKPQNIILISVESLSASYLGVYGNKFNLTPNLDRLAKDGIKYEWMYATGTRTVRGLEALSLGIPPIPGQSVVRRLNNEHLSTVGEILFSQGFSTYFFYGGYGYFDNMNSYFSGNRYQVFDRTNVDKNSIVFENIWGVADETLYDNSFKIFDNDFSKEKRFFAHFMTTSNHRPFTYPDGRVDIPSPGGRYGAVKYTDYSIGKFIEDAKKHDWFKDTLFIITADHCASVAGLTKIPVYDYHIPLILYAPFLLKPAVDKKISSQIDIPPTILDALGVDGLNHFFGQSLFDKHFIQRAFMSNYQELGYYKDYILTVLSPNQKFEVYSIDTIEYGSVKTEIRENFVNEAIAYYQTAARAYKTNKLKFERSHPDALRNQGE